jgi:hypothetical protein
VPVPGCPGSATPFAKGRLLRHLRQAHGGACDDATLSWAGGVRCRTCNQPFLSLGSHLAVDPSDNSRRCPTAIRTPTCSLRLTRADKDFVNSLAAEDVYVSTTPSCVRIAAAALPQYAAILAPLLRDCHTAASGPAADPTRHKTAWRLLHVTLAILLRPLGAQRNGRHVMLERCRRLSEGGALEELWRAAPCPRRKRRAPRSRAAAEDDDAEPPPPSHEELARRRAVRCVHAGEPGKARAALERDSSGLGAIKPEDIEGPLGSSGEATAAKEGSVLAEMLAKHPPPRQADGTVPTLTALLQAAGARAGHRTLAPGTVRTLTEEKFADVDAFQAHVSRLGRLSMPAADMIRYEHIQALCRAGLTPELRDLVMDVALGDVPLEARPFVYGARLVAPGKGDGTHRPLGAGTTWRRLAAGHLCRQMRDRFAERFGPLQLGVAVKDGPEIFAAGMRLFLESHPGAVAVKLDFRNAFNEVSRNAFLSFTAAEFPVLLPLLHAAYKEPTFLTALHGDASVRLLSRSGCTQGCPLGPFAFAAALQGALETVSREYPDCLCTSLHDDAQLAGPPDQVRRALDRLLQLAISDAGLVPAGHKFTLYSPQLRGGASSTTHHTELAALEAAIDYHTPQAQRDAGRVCRAQGEGLITAGVPIGSPDFCRQYARKRLREHERAHNQLRLLGCVQSAYLVLRYCLSARFMYWMRTLGQLLLTSEPGGIDPASEHDAQWRRTLDILMQDPHLSREHLPVILPSLPAYVYKQAALPPRMGGLGLTCAGDVTMVAFLASWKSALEYINGHKRSFRAPTLTDPNSTLPIFIALRQAATGAAAATQSARSLSSFLPGSPEVSQHTLSGELHEKRFEALLRELPDDRHRARLYSARGQFAGAWLGAFPVTGRLRVRPRLYWLALALRVGLPIRGLLPVQGVPTRCGGCGLAHDEFGFHPSSCKAGNRQAMWTTRHDVLQAALIHALRLAGEAAQPWGSTNWFGSAGWRAGRNGRSSFLRGDIVVPNKLGPARHLFLDVAVACPAIQAPLRASPPSSAQSGVAAYLRGRTKIAKYNQAAARLGCVFTPAVVERFGAVSDELVGLIRELVGDQHTDPLNPAYAFSAASRQTFLAQHLVLSTVVADAQMVETVLETDCFGSDR